ncbi:uncharacterized protein LOC130896829 [Diorhabda carinulata]|uniref:uncharacterized protein LOC130896829 n=1 Tax=Diorhabda carinulata TaxID=1163345 RepID=UPI0025A16396|nr:uncharacterized protein LOC130896829 [Diorhabda carinulata]
MRIAISSKKYPICCSTCCMLPVRDMSNFVCQSTFHMIGILKNEMEFKNEFATNRIFKEILNGNYPAQLVNKMNMRVLERFVVRLVEYTSSWAGAKTQSTQSNNVSTSNWWSLVEDLQVEKKQNKKEFRHNLKKILVYCSEFFQSYNNQWLPDSPPWINDENFDIIFARKRKKEYPCEVPPAKKRKKLLSLVEKDEEPLVNSKKYSPSSTQSTEPLSQTEFLGILKLGINNNEIPKPFISSFIRPNRLSNCPHIPFSSDIGQLMIKKENVTVSSYVKERKLDRLEWYLNKDCSSITDSNYKLAYVPNKTTANEHFYNFPVKRYHKYRDVQFQIFIHSLCKPLTVLLRNEDLPSLKKQYDKYKVSIFLPTLLDKQIRKCTRTRRKVITKEVISKSVI